MIDHKRLEAANRALATFEKSFSFEVVNNKLYIRWPGHTKMWQFARKGSHYPKFDLPTGGTYTQFIGQMVRFIKQEPTFSTTVLNHWNSSSIGDGCFSLAIGILVKAGWPEFNRCVLCQYVAVGIDWWHGTPEFPQVGPCCRSGKCEGKPPI